MVFMMSGAVGKQAFFADGRLGRVVRSLLLLLALGLTSSAAQTPAIEKIEPRIIKHTGPAVALVFNADGRRLASVSVVSRLPTNSGCCAADVLKLWDVASGQSLRSFELPQSCPPAAFSPDGRLLVTGRCEKELADTLKLWEVEKGRELGILVSASKLGSEAVAFSADGRLVASASGVGWVAIFDVHARSELRQIAGKLDLGPVLAFAPDNRWLAVVAGKDEAIRLWDLAKWREERALTGHTGEITALAFSPDGRLLASASADNTVKLWDPESGNELRTLARPKDRVFAVAFSPDGRLVASGSSDTMKLWEVDTGRELLAFERNVGGFAPLIFSPDGRWLAAGTPSGDSILLWQVATGRKRSAPLTKTSQPPGEPEDKPPRLKRKR